ncbi:MAG: hypothetical protein H3C64_01085 [Candidatus Kuenenia stuttgartiensis]|nr:hypothetical protein [Candidatus Kuenenia stuttgartiensis]
MDSKERFMKFFQRNVTELFSYSPNLIDVEHVKHLAVEYLNVKDYFKLKDKFEGQLFYDKLLSRLFSIRTYEKYAKVILLPKELDKNNVDYILSNKVGKELNIQIINFSMESNFDKKYLMVSDSIFIYQRNERSYYYIGCIYLNEFDNPTISLNHLISKLSINL